MRCNVCKHNNMALIYESGADYSITSLCQIVPGKTRVYYCNCCTHLQTPEIDNSQRFYSQEYKILVGSENEDQLYKIENASPIYRLDYQAKTVLDVIDIPKGAKVLDYGCAAAGTSSRLLKMRDDIKIHLFDISDMYLPFWKKITTDESWATFTIPEQWQNTYFDLVTSYFSLEHIADLETSMSLISSMLVDKGYFYAVVPNWQKNIGDFVVIDHANHFSEKSIRHLLKKYNFTAEVISENIHDNAFVIVARKDNSSSIPITLSEETEPFLKETIHLVSEYWKKFADRIQSNEAEILTAGEKVAIYGAGFYGTYIASCLNYVDRLACFIDQSPFRQGTELLSRKIVAPAELPSDVTAVYLGLNPNTIEEDINIIRKQLPHSVRLIVPY